jgi:hypothetical protein
MPTIEIDIPEGRPYEFVERVHRERGIPYAAILLHGADALQPVQTGPSLDEQECEMAGCTADARCHISAQQLPDRDRCYCDEHQGAGLRQAKALIDRNDGDADNS